MPLNEEVSSDPLRFVKTGHAPLSQKAQEQLLMVSQQAGSRAQQRLNAQEEDEAVDWQSKLASWKNRRRRQMPQRSLEENDPAQQQPNRRGTADPPHDRTAPGSGTAQVGRRTDGRKLGDDWRRCTSESMQQSARQNASDGTKVGRWDNLWGSLQGYTCTKDYMQESDRGIGNNYDHNNGLDNSASGCYMQETEASNRSNSDDSLDNLGGGNYMQKRDRYVGYNYDDGVVGGHDRDGWSLQADRSFATAPGAHSNPSRTDLQQYPGKHIWHSRGDNFLEEAGLNDDEDPCGDVVTTGTNLLSEFSCGATFRDSDRSRGPQWGTEHHEEIGLRHEEQEEEAPRAPPEAPSDPPLSVSGRQRCSHCRNALGHGAAMVIESLGLLYHLECFRCCVCRTPLGNGRRGTDVRVRNTKLHCCNCYSNDEGLQLSRV